jgi:hypothetical protein
LTFVLAWVAFPVVLAALGLGFGLLVEELAGAPLQTGALAIPIGLAAALVLAALLTTNGATARLAVPVDGVVALGGLVRGRRVWSRWPIPRWSLIAAVGVLVAYGAPVLATGTATFTGWVKLDDTSTWLGITAHMFSDGRSVASLQPSSYKLLLQTNLGTAAYPVGAFMLLGVGRALVHVDAAWVYQPYLACAGAGLAMCLYALTEPVVESSRLRGVVAFVAAQPALLYGYALWGGIKEMTAAFLLALIAALGSLAIRDRPAGPRATLPLAVATAALIVTFGPGTAVWVAPALGVVVAAWLVSLLRSGHGGLGRLAGTVGGLAAASAVLALPVWLVLSSALSTDAVFASATGAGSVSISLGNLRAPLSAMQVAGIWPVGDFRDALGSGFSGALPIVLIGLVYAAGGAAVCLATRARSFGVALYAGVALVGYVAIELAGGVAWIDAKALAIASPAVLLAGLTGAAMLWARSRLAGGVVLGLIAGGVLWSNVLGYHGATIAPVGPLDDLQHIGTLVAGGGPTFVNDFAVYADRYFLRAGDPVEPAEYRAVDLPLSDGTLLTKSAAADLDSFALSTLYPYRSIVTTSSPTESRPSSLYHLVWAGRYYELWQRPADPPVRVLAHVAYGDSGSYPYCGNAEGTGGGVTSKPLCSIQPVGTASCRAVRAIAEYANRHDAMLVAPERPANVFVRGDQLQRPSDWGVDPSLESITALHPGTASLKVKVGAPEYYDLWLGGSFGRGFVVALDGRRIGRVENDLSMIDGYAPVAGFELTSGIHTITLTYPRAGLAPGSGDELLSTLDSVVLAPITPGIGQLTTLSPRDATELCGKSVDWIEVVAPSTKA